MTVAVNRNNMTLLRRMIFVAAAGTLVCCNMHRQVPKIPKSTPEAKRPALEARLERGSSLYADSCAKCHGKTGKGRQGVPALPRDDVDKYSIFYMNRTPTMHASAQKMNPDQLEDVLFYLKFKVNGARSAHPPFGP